jgi:tRNA(His) 5'-end guanylyltransferase
MHTFAYWKLRHKNISASKATKMLNGLSWQDKDTLLREQHGISFYEMVLWAQQGVGIYWETYQKTGYNPIKKEEVIAERRRTAVIDVGLGDQHKTWLCSILQEHTA